MRSMSVVQREAIRSIADNPDAEMIDPRTLRALLDRGLIKHLDATDYTLTARGRVAFKRIMATGDGPEQLKEHFRIRISK